MHPDNFGCGLDSLRAEMGNELKFSTSAKGTYESWRSCDPPAGMLKGNQQLFDPWGKELQCLSPAESRHEDPEPISEFYFD